TGGVIFHYDGFAWSTVPSPTTITLTTIFGGGASDIWAVGGIDGGLLLHYDGAAWSIAAQDFSPAGLTAVWTEPGASAIIAGYDGYAARYNPGYGADPLPTGIMQGLHAVFGDGFGMWAVGGNLLGGTGPGGVIMRYGSAAAACDITDFMQPVLPGTDAGVDAGSTTDPCPGGTATVGPGGICGSGRDCQCQDGLMCWYVTICWAGGPRSCPPTGNAYSHFVCTAPCGSDADCQTAYGAGACCIVPGKQTTTSVCHSPGYMPTDGDVCSL
ncbi:MAG TPA: hypothetical protein VG389_12730, partial [Myxococcota bacterium]|nr:hypothetical protein [Myxococcota bacterium]